LFFFVFEHFDLFIKIICERKISKQLINNKNGGT